MTKIDTSRYVASHMSEPAPSQFGQWILERKDQPGFEISRCCSWKHLKAMKLEFEWYLLP
jgi:hypothetical protein